MPGPEAIGRQRRAAMLSYIRRYHREHGGSPSVREIAEAVGLTSPSAAHRHLQRLTDDGYLRRLPHHWRNIELVDPAPDGWTEAKR